MGSRRKTLVCCLVGILLIFIVFYLIRQSKKQQTKPTVSLSADVESVMRDFNYQENDGQVSVNIVGKEAVMRGRKVMVFRSNLAKTTFFKEVHGSIISKKSAINFTAEIGEWDTAKKSPFILSKNINLTVDGKAISGVKSIAIDFFRRVLETSGNRRSIYNF